MKQTHPSNTPKRHTLRARCMFARMHLGAGSRVPGKLPEKQRQSTHRVKLKPPHHQKARCEHGACLHGAPQRPPQACKCMVRANTAGETRQSLRFELQTRLHSARHTQQHTRLPCKSGCPCHCQAELLRFYSGHYIYTSKGQQDQHKHTGST